jgi:hypothetical protein
MAPVDVNREVTPALLRGRRGSVRVLRDGELAPGLEGQLAHHVYADGTRRRESTVVLTSVPEGLAFAPALVCRDREELGGAPAQLPAERWVGVELESTAFNRRYRLLTLAGQDQIYARELFSPALIAWLAHDVPSGFTFELNERHLLIALPGHLTEDDDLDRLCRLAAELARRMREEATEEGEDSGLFDEADHLAEIDRRLGEVHFAKPPGSVGLAYEAFREKARRRPTVLLRTAFWTLLAFALVATPLALLFNPLIAIVPAAIVAYLAYWIASILIASDYSRRGVSVRRLGLEAFMRGYADSRGLRLEDRRRFHSRHRGLPLPGTASHVLAGPIPGTDREGLLVALGDAAELRSRGVEVAHTADRPLAALALVVELGTTAEAERLVAAPPLVPASPSSGAASSAEPLHVERHGATVAIWRPEPGNITFSAPGFDRFRAACGELLAQVGEHGEHPAVAAV